MSNRQVSPVAAASAGTVNFTDIHVWMVLIAGFSVFLTVYATQTLLPLFRGIFHASQFKVSLTVSATTIGIALASPAAGLLAERFGRRRILTTALFLLTLPVFLSATAPSLTALIAWRFIQGLVMPGIIAITIAYVGEEWSGGGAAMVMAAYVTGNVLGGVTGRLLSGVVAEHLGWRMVFVTLGTLNAAGALAVWRWLPRSHVIAMPRSLPLALRGMAKHLRNPALLATFAIGMGSLFALVATFTYITFYLAAPPFHLGTAMMGLLFLVYLVGVVATPISGWWIERVGQRRALSVAAPLAAGGIALTLVHSLPLVIVGLAICCSGIFTCQSAAASYLGRIAEKARSSAAGVYTTFFYIGGTLGAALPAAAWALGGWPGCVALASGVLLSVTLLALIAWEKPSLRLGALDATHVSALSASPA